MQTLNLLRADDADPLWPDRDRVLAAPDAVPPEAAAAIALGGPPGLAFGAALGLALAERLLASRFGRSLVDHRTWLLAGAEELAAGPSQEAAAIAGALGLGRLTVIARLPATEGAALARFAAVGWTVRRVIAGQAQDLEAAVSAALRAQKPTLIAALVEGDAGHGDHVAMAASPYGAGARRAWLKRLRRHAAAAAYQQAMAGAPAPRLPTSDAGPMTAAAAVQDGLTRLAQIMPELVVLPGPDAVWSGRHHATAGALLGLALHGGILPAASFPASAWAAVLPARQAAAARRLKMLIVAAASGAPEEGFAAPEFRPGTETEAADCLALALRWPGPAIMAPAANAVEAPSAPQGACAQGGYRLAGVEHATVTLIAAGADLKPALALQDSLLASGTTANVTSLPCRRLFAAQDAANRQVILGGGLRIFLGTGNFLAWAGLTSPDDLVLDTGAGIDAEAVAARIERRLRRSPAILDQPELLLESAPEFD
jgi:transketolase